MENKQTVDGQDAKIEGLTKQITALNKQNQELVSQLRGSQEQLAHFIDELRFVLGIAIQARPEIEELRAMAKELYRVEVQNGK